jgi:hypothetical protein
LLSDALLARIRGEYREMPGLRLTVAQACRLWQLDAPTCTAVIEARVALPPTPKALKVEQTFAGVARTACWSGST